ncbi:outer membrane beta-barrel protein [Bradyrhizobium sp.]|uniref:outer membrane protein n=1 Tax=Bradyrhizobium sp. TaxID=376 RepID=UPI002384B3F8|nr:outer membrane beta-barrel protein [Bradyrhizobium sp.]MDE2378446.1 porin family protein [Bradyrhizobium sp.]
MKKLAITIAALTASTVAASAADMAPRYTKAPPPVPAVVYNWTGFYIGVNGGGGWGRQRWQYAGAAVDTNHDISGGLAGGQVGYNWQAGAWVFGLEADGDWADINGSAACPNAAFVCATNVRTLASFRGRLGYAAGPVLFYGTGGAGFADARYSATAPGGPNFFYSSDRWGYAAGAGIEWGFMPNWSAKFEYMHYGFGTWTAPAGALSALSSADLRLDIDTFKVGINYRFGGGPVVAKY